MEDIENNKFNLILDHGFQDLVSERPRKPITHFIHNILSKISPEELEQHLDLKEFYEKYQNELNQNKIE